MHMHIHKSDRRFWVFRDVVFQDVVRQTASFKPVPHISFRCEIPTPSVFEGR